MITDLYCNTCGKEVHNEASVKRLEEHKKQLNLF